MSTTQPSNGDGIIRLPRGAVVRLAGLEVSCATGAEIIVTGLAGSHRPSIVYPQLEPPRSESRSKAESKPPPHCSFSCRPADQPSTTAPTGSSDTKSPLPPGRGELDGTFPSL